MTDTYPPAAYVLGVGLGGAHDRLLDFNRQYVFVPLRHEAEFGPGGERRVLPLAAVLGSSDHDRAEERPVRRQAGQNGLHVA